jgi:hypothetical protein
MGLKDIKKDGSGNVWAKLTPETTKELLEIKEGEVKEEKDGSLWVKVRDEKKKLWIGFNFIEEFVSGGRGSLDELLAILSKKEMREAILYALEQNRYNGEFFKSFMDKLELFEKYVPDIKAKIRKIFNDFSTNLYLDPEEVLKMAKVLEVDKQEIEKCFEDRVLYWFGYGDIDHQAEEISREVLCFGRVCPERARLIVKEHVDNVLWDLGDDEIVMNIKRARGEFFADFVRSIIIVERLRNFVSQREMEMIQKLLLRRIELIRKIVKNRIKLPSHQSYLKAIISLLPEESKREFIPYII